MMMMMMMMMMIMIFNFDIFIAVQCVEYGATNGTFRGSLRARVDFMGSKIARQQLKMYF